MNSDLVAKRASRAIILLTIWPSALLILIVSVHRFSFSLDEFAGLRDSPDAIWAYVLGIVFFGLPMFGWYLSRRILRRVESARTMGMVVAVIQLPLFPFGTLVSAYALWFLAFKWRA